MITTLLLDAGGTIVFPDWGRIAAELAADGVDVEPTTLMVADARARRFLDEPATVAVTGDAERWTLYMDAVARGCGLSETPRPALARLAAYHARFNLWSFVPADVPEALERLSQRFRLGLISNANGTVRARLQELGLADRFEIVLDSHEEGVEKPDPRIFERGLERMGVAAGEAAYVGDFYHVDVVGARAAGLSAVLLDPEDLHADRDCPRVRALADVADVIDRAVDARRG
jgi:putative hydrolase of the HAD superfamily